MNYSDYCSSCLITDVRLHSSLAISGGILSLLRFPRSSKIETKPSFCYECTHLLRKFEQFKRKCKKAQEIVLELHQNYGEVTKMHVQKVDRMGNNLVSTMVQTECVAVTHTKESLIPEIPLPKLVKINHEILNNKPSSQGNNPNLLNKKLGLLRSKHNMLIKNPSILKSIPRSQSYLIGEKDTGLDKYDVNEVQANDDEEKGKELMHSDGEEQMNDGEEQMNDGEEQSNDDNDGEEYLNCDDDNNDDFDFSDSTSDSSIDDTQETTEKLKRKTKPRKSNEKYIIENLSDVDDNPFSFEVSKMIEEYQDRPKKTGRKEFQLEFFEQYMTVEFLTMEDAKRELLLRKQSSNYINSPFKCDLCYRGYETEVAFNNHLQTHSEENGSFKCELCQIWFSKRRPHGAHVLGWHKRKFTCKLCSFITYNTDNARAHIVNLHKDKDYPCKKCGEKFSSPESLLAHARDTHVTEYVCERCGSSLATLLELTEHYSANHALDDNVKNGPVCEECSIQFYSDTAYRRHLAVSAKHSACNGCKHCGEIFSSIEELKDHMIIHAKKPQLKKQDTIELPTVCIYCAEYLSTLPEYESHMSGSHPDTELARRLRGEEDKPFVCEICGLSFKKRCFLQHHQYTHNENCKYPCGHCEQSFSLLARLYRHRATAHAHLYQDRPLARTRPRRKNPPPGCAVHACSVCDRTFSFKSGLYRHAKTHLHRPFTCDICEKGFVYQCELRQHIKYVHVEGWPKRNRSRKLRT